MNFFASVYKNRHILWGLVKSDFKNRYLGSHLGIIWAFFQPLVMIAIYWFVFTHGFKTPPVENVPFLAWLLCGIIPWLLINDAIMGSSRAIVDQVFLVKKIVFEIRLLPLVKIGSAFLVNIVFWCLLFLCLLMYKFYPGFIWLQGLYYLFCILAFTLGMSLILSSITVFLLDVSQFVNIVMQVLFWGTPIFWNISMIPHKYIWIFELINPFIYIIEGMRNALLFNIPFWVHYKLTIYFWVVTCTLFFLGNKVFTKLRPHFADVL